MSTAVTAPEYNHLRDFWLITCHCFLSFRWLPVSWLIGGVLLFRRSRGEMIHLNSLTAFKQTQKAMCLLSGERGLVNDSCLACLMPSSTSWLAVPLFVSFICNGKRANVWLCNVRLTMKCQMSLAKVNSFYLTFVHFFFFLHFKEQSDGSRKSGADTALLF